MNIGATLKEARDKKSLTLEDVHSKTKIHPRVLQLLEEDKFEKLPSPLFVKSFLKSYADFLSIDANTLIEIYEREEKKEPEQKLFLEPASPTERISGGKSRFGMAIPAIAVLAVVFLGGWLVWGRVSDGMARKKMSPRASKLAKIEAGKRQKPAAQAKSSPEALKKSREWLRSVEAGNFPVLDRKAPLELKVKAVDNVWLRITCDKKVLFQSILKRGTAESWTARETIEIWTGNSSNMVLFLNGTSLGSPGKGVVKKMLISHEGVKVPV